MGIGCEKEEVKLSSRTLVISCSDSEAVTVEQIKTRRGLIHMRIVIGIAEDKTENKGHREQARANNDQGSKSEV